MRWPVWEQPRVRHRLTPTHCCLLALLLCQHCSAWLYTNQTLTKDPLPTDLPAAKRTRKHKRSRNLAASVWPERGCRQSCVSQRVNDGRDTVTGKATPPRAPLDDIVCKPLINVNQQPEPNIVTGLYRVHWYSTRLSSGFVWGELVSPLSPTSPPRTLADCTASRISDFAGAHLRGPRWDTSYAVNHNLILLAWHVPGARWCFRPLLLPETRASERKSAEQCSLRFCEENQLGLRLQL